MGDLLKPKKSRKRIKILASLTLVFAIVLTVYVLMRIMSSPAEGTVSTGKPKTQINATLLAQPGEYKGRSMNFKFPNGYALNQSPPISGTYKEIADLSAINHSNIHITVGVFEGRLNEYSGLITRRQKTDVYKESRDSKGNIVFTNSSDGSERLTYITHGNLISAVALTSSSVKDLKADSDYIVNSFVWKQ